VEGGKRQERERANTKQERRDRVPGQGRKGWRVVRAEGKHQAAEAGTGARGERVGGG
jgi:hypothetical protein